MRFLVLPLVLWLSVPLGAITIQPLSFEELVTDSSAVVYGRIAGVRGQWTSDRQGIDSLVTVETLEYFKGALGDAVTVRVPGGQVGPIVHVLPGAPTFATGDRVVLFLKAVGPSIPIVTGTTQGVFRVARDSRTGAPMVVPPIVGRNSPPGPVVRGAPSRRPLSLAEFGAAVRDAGVAR
jgi:hypothetical protein